VSALVPQSPVEEPLLAVDEIQGDILAGLGRRVEALIFFVSGQRSLCKKWLRGLVPRIATTAEVLATRPRGHGGRRAPHGVWINVSFSWQALLRLCADADRFTDPAFREGLARRANLLGDPVEESSEGHPQQWRVGGPGREADGVLLVAGDDRRAVRRAAAELEQSLWSTGGGRVLFIETGARLAGRGAGNEHFGFRDEVSQPGVRGLLPGIPPQPLTPRHSPNDLDHGKPGQILVWPGEFVFGYPGQDPRGTLRSPGPDLLSDACPPWARHGSFLVVRRLRQDVYAFHRFVRDSARRLGIPPARLAAQLIGRWPSGSSLVSAAEGGSAPAEEMLLDAFVYHGSDPQAGGDVLAADPAGIRCPISAHVRRMHPRDIRSREGNTFPNPSDTQTHRLLRRGIPYGQPSRSSPEVPVEDGVDRGLLFLCYQTSIEEQFEFVVRRWANEPNFPEPLSGHDPLIGQNPRSERRKRTFRVAAGDDGTLTTDLEWVVPTGGGYFFAPSITALRLLSS
jgi:Dyp-type peroxidase family